MVNRLRFFAMLCLGAPLDAGCVAAQETQSKLRPAIIGKDDRERVDRQGRPWDAIGQVNVSGYRSRYACTGTLVAPDRVLTAAHCVMDRWKMVPYPAHNIHFLAGVRGSKRKGHATAKCLRFIKGYRYTPPPRSRSGGLPEQALMKDAVVIVLAQELAVEPAALATGLERRRGLELVHAAYSADRRHALSVHFGCRLVSVGLATGLWRTSCDTHPASSGGPVFVRANGKLKLAAVMSGGNRIASIAVPLSAWGADGPPLNQLLGLSCPEAQ